MEIPKPLRTSTRFLNLFKRLILLTFLSVLANLRLSTLRIQQTQKLITAEQPNATCALLFFGLPRHFRKIVLPSLQEYVFPYTKDCDIYVHTYNVTSVMTPRNGEKGQVNVFEILDVNPKAYMFETDQEFQQKYNLSWFASLHNPWREPVSIINMVKQWNSLEAGWSLIEKSEIKYKTIVFLRSDVFYVTPLTPSILNSTAAVPNFAEYPVNDRAFIGNYENAQVWANQRFSQVVNYTAHKDPPTLHSESFMNEAILPLLGDPSTIPVCFFRVRVHGTVQTDDCICGLNEGHPHQCNYSPPPEHSLYMIKNLTGLDCKLKYVRSVKTKTRKKKKTKKQLQVKCKV